MIKRILCISLAFIMVAGILPVYATDSATQTELPVCDINEIVEFEDGYKHKSGISFRASKTASGGNTAYVVTGAYTTPTSETEPDISFKVNIPKDGVYSICVRYSPGLNMSGNSFYERWDNEKYYVNWGKVGETFWKWHVTEPRALTAGEHTLSFLRRAGGCVLDAFVVTEDVSTVDMDAIDARIEELSKLPNSSQIALESTAPTVQLVGGRGMIEAEDGLILPERFSVGEDVNASGGTYISPIRDATYHSVLPDATLNGYELNFLMDEASNSYAVWVRARVKGPGGGEDSLYVSLDGGSYSLAPNYNQSEEIDAPYVWRKVAVFPYCDAGSKHNFRLFPREAGSRIDKIVITNEPTYTPNGMLGTLSANPPLDSTAYPAPPVVPTKGQHPRLYFTENAIPRIKENMEHPANANPKGAFQNRLASVTDGDLNVLMSDNLTNYDTYIIQALEAFAFEYAINGTLEYGLRAKEGALKLLNTASFDAAQSDITRERGHIIFTASQVYDWCYDLFTQEEREFVIMKCEGIADLMEIGWPPSQGTSIGGHTGEAELMRNLLGFAIAVYDERPDIYNYVAGRFFSEYIEGRNYMYDSGMHNQGTSYGPYRYHWEMMGQQLISAMTDGEVRPFNDDQADIPYSWFYSRRPDGQMFRDGDVITEGTNGFDYWGGEYNNLFDAAHFYNDPYIKGEYDIQNSNNAASNYLVGTTGVYMLIFSNPELVGIQDKSALPLTKYFPEAAGRMIARTGWETDPERADEIDDVAVVMQIRERTMGYGHQHLDAGSFQIYYKGMLSGDTGLAVGSIHSWTGQNYYYRSVAHNTITVYDPDETFYRFSGPDNNGNNVTLANGSNDGGQRWLQTTPKTYEDWLSNDTYKVGDVLDHAFGPDKIKPEYSYIRGDVAPAYGGHTDASGNVVPKVSQVNRAMAFMPIEDENYPAIFVVFDKVTSTDANFKKKMLIHTYEEPTVYSSSIITTTDTRPGYNGKLTIHTLLPKTLNRLVVGGEGKQFWVGNQAGDFLNDGYNFTPETLPAEGTAYEYGWGRIEISSTRRTEQDKFLNVMAVSDADNTAVPLDSTLIEGTNFTGVKTSDKVIMFADVETTIADKNRVLDSGSFTIPETEGMVDILVAGVKAGTWNVECGDETRQFVADEEEGTLYFEGVSGDYTLTYIGNERAATITKIKIGDEKTTKTITVNTSGAPANSILMVIVTDENDRVLYTKGTACDERTTYEFTVNKSLLPDGKVNVKAFLWDSLIGMNPLATSKVNWVTKEGTN